MSKAFSVFLQDLQDGRTHSELSAKLTELIEAVRSTGRAGEIVLAIKVLPATRGDVDKVICVLYDLRGPYFDQETR